VTYSANEILIYPLGPVFYCHLALMLLPDRCCKSILSLLVSFYHFDLRFFKILDFVL